MLATDAWLDAGGTMANVSEATMATLNAALPPTWSHANPIDIVGDAGADRYQAALAALLTDSGIDTILALNCPTGVSSPSEAADGVLGRMGQTAEIHAAQPDHLLVDLVLAAKPSGRNSERPESPPSTPSKARSAAAPNWPSSPATSG